jgi:hypothetical protein
MKDHMPPTARLVIKEEAQVLLQNLFAKTRYPGKAELENLAQRTNLSFSQIKTWFNNNRSRLLRKREALSVPLSVRANFAKSVLKPKG